MSKVPLILRILSYVPPSTIEMTTKLPKLIHLAKSEMEAVGETGYGDKDISDPHLARPNVIQVDVTDTWFMPLALCILMILLELTYHELPGKNVGRVLKLLSLTSR